VSEGSVHSVNPHSVKRSSAHAVFLGQRIGLRELARHDVVATSPLTLRAPSGGHAVVFRFGALVLFDLDEAERSRLVEAVAPHVDGPFEVPQWEAVEIVYDPKATEGLDAQGVLTLQDTRIERVQVLAHVLAKSVALAHYEEQVARVFERVEALADRLRGGESPRRGRELLRDIGDVLFIRARTVGRVEVVEKPELTWDAPDLDRLYQRLALDYELVSRDAALSRKLEIIAETAETHLDLLMTRRGLRLEWYIIILILFEIVLLVYELFTR